MFQPKRILVPMDFSDEAQLALDWAVMLAGQTTGGSVFPIYIFSILPDTAALDVGRSDYKNVTEAWVKDNMRKLEDRLPDHVSCVPVCGRGNPANEIVDICRLKGIDLIVMTTHGRKGISHLLHTSVAEELVRLASCPVLVLHMNRVNVETVHKPLTR